jgi:hypothetical protein
MRGSGPGQREQRDLGRGVEAEPEQDAEWIHVPGLRDCPRRAAEDSVEQSALVQCLLEADLVEPAAATKACDQAAQDDEIEIADCDEEGAGDRRAGDRRRPLESAEAADAEHYEQPEREHDRRMAEREEEPDAQRSLSLAHQFARAVVDRCDVVGVERVTQT